MPVTKKGVRADIVMDDIAVVNRMNLGRVYEQYLNAASTKLTMDLRELFDLDPHFVSRGEAKSAIKDTEKVNIAMGKLLRYYEIISPVMNKWFTEGQYEGTDEEHVMDVLRNGIYLFTPTDNQVYYPDVIKQLQVEFPPEYDTVSYLNDKGELIETKKPVLIGSVYCVLLDKIADAATGIASAKTQQFGLIAKLTQGNRNNKPVRQQPVRVFGETEIRLLSAYGGDKLAAEVIDLNNNSTTHRAQVDRLLNSDKPTAEYKLIDRRDYPLGKSRVNQMLRHVMECAGVHLVREVKK